MTENKWEKRFLFDITRDSTPVPNLLLKYFHQLGLSEGEFVFLLQIFMMGKNGLPSPPEISEILSLEVAVVKQNLAALIEKGFIVPENSMDAEKTTISRYYFDGLYDKLMDLWAYEMAGKTEIAAGSEKSRVVYEQEFATVFRAFEKEFGRPLSPMENEKIAEWLDELGYSPEVVLESLKRAVLRGVYNLNYIDKILLEWKKSNVRTVNEVLNHEKGRMAKGKSAPRKITAGKNHAKNLEDLYEL
ncbi:DnaD domain-containing protein [Candidatus Formimonas warabiya]|uniref:Uncharacterized protein n=1 Tax=Formimonas warabiya TaxID=1761012 RepID=A0A3G1KPG7_FORW1|nr:DnaD domain protein [Candidatus Formimonas warabiya]ATW24363.1 hypothetical protein DCMF_05800 [Candidatus Formimonas warabiya]